jgi:hypothetical protein
VSLLEVLIAVGVLTIGLLGVAAMLPVGRFEIVEAAKADRSAACGKAGLRDVKVRGMLNPRCWRTVNGVPVTTTNTLRFGQVFAIDPLYVARNVGAANIQRFPYNPIAPQRMNRVTLAPANDSNPPASFYEPLFDRIFTWRDDFVFSLPEEKTERPRQMILDSADVGRPFPWLPGDEPAPGTPLVPQALGKYSWMATVTPTVAEHELFDPQTRRLYYYYERHPEYDVSIVVFYRRDFSPPGSASGDEPPGERQVMLEFLGGGWGGGDVLLATSDLSVDPVNLDVREHHWLLVSGRYQYLYVDNNGAPQAPLSVGVHKWYRIVAAGEVAQNTNPSRWERLVTLDGPDWNIDQWSVDLNNDGDANEAYATLLTGVIGVYTTTVEMD